MRTGCCSSPEGIPCRSWRTPRCGPSVGSVPARCWSRRARACFGARGRGFTVLVRAHADTDLAGAAADAGLLAMGEMPAMVLQRRLADAVAPRGVDLRPVTTPEDVAAYGQVMGAAYATYGMPEDVLPSMLGNLDTLRAPHIVAFVARVEGKPVAGAMTVVTHGVAGIYWVGTTPD